MKIVFLCRLFYPHIGGVEKHVMEISTRLIKKGYEVVVITEMLDSRFQENDVESIDGIQVYRIKCGADDKARKFRIWKEMFRLKDIIQEADIVHCHDVFFWYLPFRFFYLNKPVYTTFHGYESYPITNSSILMRKLSEKLSWGNICIGDFISKWYGTKATYISYGAVEIPKSKIKQVKFKKDSAIFIGRLDEQTGAPIYAKAIELVRKNYPKFEFTIIGDGKDRKKLEKRFKVLGFQKNPERSLSEYHFAFVSRYLSILEAFAEKKLVFAVYDNPVKEDYLMMAPYAKWIVVEKTPVKLAEKISYFLTHSEQERKLIENAYRWVKGQTWQLLVSNYINLWEGKKKNKSF